MQRNQTIARGRKMNIKRDGVQIEIFQLQKHFQWFPKPLAYQKHLGKLSNSYSLDNSRIIKSESLRMWPRKCPGAHDAGRPG